MGRVGAVLSVILLLVLPGAPASAQNLDCAEFASQAEAQAALDADPSAPNGLDPDGDGVACEELAGDVEGDPAVVDRASCGFFATQPDAQAALDGGQVDPSVVDPDGDGIACEELPPGAVDEETATDPGTDEGTTGEATTGGETGTDGEESVTICVGTGGESTGPTQITRAEYDARVAEGREPTLPDPDGGCPGIQVVPNVCDLLPDGTYEQIVVQPRDLDDYLAANPGDFKHSFYDGPCAEGDEDADGDTEETDGTDTGEDTAADGDGEQAGKDTAADVSGGLGEAAPEGESEAPALSVVSPPTTTRRVAVQDDAGPGLPDDIPSDATEAEVVRVIDGDTIEVEITEDDHPEEGETKDVRLILIDTPETRHPTQGVECFGREATARTTRMLRGRTVLLERDVSDTDRFGRLLRYVWFEGKRDGSAYLANELLVREGYAVLSTYPPDVEYVEPIREAQQEAVEEEAGLWDECGGADTPLNEDTDTDQDANAVAVAEPTTEALVEADPVERTASQPAVSTGGDLNCSDFATQAEAQAVYNQDPSDPYGLDGPIGPDNDTRGTPGVACEGNP